MRRVFVGISGGVDSAVAALLLQRAGFEVVGVFIKGWEPDFLPCTGAADRLSAMRVAAHLKIPFITYDFSAEYEAAVVQPFVAEYRAGRTPNPDVLCNRAIKFGAFWSRTQADGASYLATGHYARVVPIGGSYALGTARDREKDQTYFLWTLGQEDLSHTLFPVGEHQKSQIRRIAADAGLPNATRPDSQGLCFLGHVDMQSFLKRYISPARGAVMSRDGEQVGEHDGVWFYTIGQRVPVQRGEKMYVIEKRIAANQLVVSTDPAAHGGVSEYALDAINWVSGHQPTENLYARVRYRGELHHAVFEHNSVRFGQPVLAASGQSVVFYAPDRSQCLGGGIIR